MRIPDLERQIEMNELHYREYCKNCGNHISQHTRRLHDSGLYCHKAPGRKPGGFFEDMVTPVS